MAKAIALVRQKVIIPTIATPPAEWARMAIVLGCGIALSLAGRV